MNSKVNENETFKDSNGSPQEKVSVDQNSLFRICRYFSTKRLDADLNLFQFQLNALKKNLALDKEVREKMDNVEERDRQNKLNEQLSQELITKQHQINRLNTEIGDLKENLEQKSRRLEDIKKTEQYWKGEVFSLRDELSSASKERLALYNEVQNVKKKLKKKQELFRCLHNVLNDFEIKNEVEVQKQKTLLDEKNSSIEKVTNGDDHDLIWNHIPLKEQQNRISPDEFQSSEEKTKLPLQVDDLNGQCEEAADSGIYVQYHYSDESKEEVHLQNQLQLVLSMNSSLKLFLKISENKVKKLTEIHRQLLSKLEKQPELDEQCFNKDVNVPDSSGQTEIFKHEDDPFYTELNKRLEDIEKRELEDSRKRKTLEHEITKLRMTITDLMEQKSVFIEKYKTVKEQLVKQREKFKNQKLRLSDNWKEREMELLLKIDRNQEKIAAMIQERETQLNELRLRIKHLTQERSSLKIALNEKDEKLSKANFNNLKLNEMLKTESQIGNKLSERNKCLENDLASSLKENISGSPKNQNREFSLFLTNWCERIYQLVENQSRNLSLTAAKVSEADVQIVREKTAEALRQELRQIENSWLRSSCGALKSNQQENIECCKPVELNDTIQEINRSHKKAQNLLALMKYEEGVNVLHLYNTSEAILSTSFESSFSDPSQDQKLANESSNKSC